jgi:hypothetical protein
MGGGAAKGSHGGTTPVPSSLFLLVEKAVVREEERERKE